MLPDLIVGPRRLARLAFGLLPVAVGVGGFWLASAAWGPTWPALLVGGLIGWLLGGGLQRVLVPTMAVEADLAPVLAAVAAPGYPAGGRSRAASSSGRDRCSSRCQ